MPTHLRRLFFSHSFLDAQFIGQHICVLPPHHLFRCIAHIKMWCDATNVKLIFTIFPVCCFFLLFLLRSAISIWNFVFFFSSQILFFVFFYSFLPSSFHSFSFGLDSLLCVACMCARVCVFYSTLVDKVRQLILYANDPKCTQRIMTACVCLCAVDVRVHIMRMGCWTKLFICFDPIAIRRF